jgi:HlyD family secretion protein
MKKVIYISVLVVVVIAGYFIVKSLNGATSAAYQFTTITRGDLESTISATGTLSPVTTVDVGTQVSGTIDSVFVDYNDNVKEGQLLAVLDTLVLKMAVLDAEANVDKAKATLEQVQSDLGRSKQLFEKKMISDSDLLNSEVAVKTQQATLKSANVALERAQRNLQYAFIRSPISGTVISKDVETGQTVAASFSTPTLFKIAEDLSNMEILTDVDESDIGSIKAGQEVRFQVQAYPEKTFSGTVTQVRMEPTTVSNVVTYTVVVSATNESNLLLPGMTATVDFIIEHKNDVLLVSNKALRFSPPEEQLQEYLAKRRAEAEKVPDSLKTGQRPGAEAEGGPSFGGSQPGGVAAGHQRSKDMARVWYIDSNGHLQMAMFRAGMTDGVNTEIVRSRDLKEGMQVISGLETNSNGLANNSRSQSGFPHPPRGF